MHAKMRQISLLDLIWAKQQTDPAQAAKLTDEVTDDGLRVVAVASNSARTDPSGSECGENGLQRPAQQLQEMGDDPVRLAATIALTKAASARWGMRAIFGLLLEKHLAGCRSV